MWTLLDQNKTDLPFYLKVDVLDSRNNVIQDYKSKDAFGYRVLLWNHVKLWKKMFSKAKFQEMMLTSNEGIETDEQKFLHNGLSILHSPEQEDKKTILEISNGNINLELLRVGPIVWKVKFELTLCDAEDFFCFVTQPLLMVVKDQIQSESSLRIQLLKKDQEIQGFLEMLPENSPLMRCLRTKKYNDQEHRDNHRAVVELFGTDPEEVVCPPQVIRYKRVLPDLQYDDKLDMKKSNSVETPPGPSTAIKIERRESTNGGSSQINTVQIPEVKHEPINHIGKPNDVKIESRDISELIHVKTEPQSGTSEPNDGTIVSELNGNQSQANSAKKTPTQSPIKTETSTGAEYLSIPEHRLNTENPTGALHSISPDVKPSQGSLASTPKKRRKNLNY